MICENCHEKAISSTSLSDVDLSDQIFSIFTTWWKFWQRKFIYSLWRILAPCNASDGKKRYKRYQIYSNCKLRFPATKLRKHLISRVYCNERKWMSSWKTVDNILQWPYNGGSMIRIPTKSNEMCTLTVSKNKVNLHDKEIYSKKWEEPKTGKVTPQYWSTQKNNLKGRNLLWW